MLVIAMVGLSLGLAISLDRGFSVEAPQNSCVVPHQLSGFFTIWLAMASQESRRQRTGGGHKAGRPRKCRLRMGWKTINGRRYYYKSEREGGRVKTTYFGAGESGLLISRLESMERAEREAERDERRAEREEIRGGRKGRCGMVR